MATPRFIPITLQVLFGDFKAKLTEMRNELGGVGQKTVEAFSNQAQGNAKNLSQTIKEIAQNSSNAKQAVAAFNAELARNKSLQQELTAQKRTSENTAAIRKSLNEGQVNSGFTNSLRNLLPSIGGLQGELGGATSGLVGFASIAGTAAGVVLGLSVALGAATLELAKQADELKLTSAVTGLSIQQLQTYQNAAKITGNSVNVLTDGVLQYRQRAKEALTGNFELARSFNQLGLNLNTAVANPSASFESLLNQLQKLPNDVSRVNAIQKIFGETNRELTGIIISLTENQGELRKELAATGNAMSDQSVKDLSRLNRDYELLKLKVENLAKGALVSLYNSTELVNVRVLLASSGLREFTSEQQKAPGAINTTTNAIDGQANAVSGLGQEITTLQAISNTQKVVGDVVADIAYRAKNAKDAVAQFKQELKLNDDTNAAVRQLKEFSEKQKALKELLEPTKTRASRGGGKTKEVSELEQLQKQVREISKDLIGFQNLTSQEFKLRLELEDKRNLKSELESIIKLRRSLGEPVAVALPGDLPGVEKEKARLNELKNLKDLGAKFDLFGPLKAATEASNAATGEQFQALDKIINDALPKVEPLTVAAAVAQTQLYQSLLKTNPALAEYYLRQGQAADATIRTQLATEQFASLRDQLNSQLDQFSNLTVTQTTALKLQSDAYKDLTQAQRDQLLGLAQQIDQQNAFRAQIEESQRRTEAFANQLRGVFDRLLDGPKAFFDNLKNTLKRTLSQMLSDVLTSQVLKILGIVPGGKGAGAGGQGFGGLSAALSGGNAGGGSGAGGGGIGGAISQAVTGGLNVGSNNAALTGGFSGGNPAGNILNQVTGGGGFGGLISKGGGLLGKLFGFGGGGATKAASGAVSAAKAATGIGTQAASAAGTAASSGGFLSSIFGGGGATLFTNPIGAIIGGALIAAPFIIGLFKDRTFNRFRNEVKKAYQIEVDKKQEGRSLFQGAEQVGKNAFGKEYKNRIPELIQLRSVKEQIAQYGIATGQDKSSLVRQFVNKQKLGDPDDPQNQIVRREFGGPVRRGDTVLVGERRPEILVPGSDGFVFPSIAAYERQLIAALQKRAARGFFGGAFSKLAGQIEASAFSRSAGGGSATAGGGGNDLMLSILGELTQAVAGLRGIPAGHVVSQALKENPNLATRALATDMRSSSPESKEVLKRAKGYK